VQILKKIKVNFLFRVISYTGILGIFRLIIGLISQKAIAVFVGAPGLAVLANFRNLLEILGSFSTVGTQNGIIAETASSKDTSSPKMLMNTIISLFMGATILIAILLFWKQEWIAMQLYLGESNGVILQAIVFSFPFMGLMIFVEGVLSGKKAFKAISALQLILAGVTAVLMVLFLYLFGLEGGLIALLLRPFFGFGIYFYYLRSSKYKTCIPKTFKFQFSQLRGLLPYIAMALISVSFVHAVEVGLRILITHKIDIFSAGLWTAMNSVSSNYFIFVTAVFTVYVLPKFSENNPSFSLLSEAKSIFKMLMPIVSIGMIAIYFLRIPIIKLLYTTEFIQIASLFKWQLAADWFRILFLVFGYYLVAKKRLVDYFIVELFSFAVFVGASIFLIDSYGIEGVVMANALRFVGCLILVVFLLREKLV
jgi:PST family polysaccharide transporter